MKSEIGHAPDPIQKTVYQRALAEVSFGRDSIHNDEYTKGKGYPGALVSSYVLTGYISELMLREFGTAWLSSGWFALNFTGKGLQQGDRIAIGGVVTAVEPQAEGRRVSLDVWIEKAGARPVVGRASGLLPPSRN